MQDHVLAAVHEQHEQWLRLIAGLSETQRIAPLQPVGWSIKDHLTHLNAWQQRSIARLDAAAQGHEPRYPAWAADGIADPENATESVNAAIIAAGRQLAWNDAFERWTRDYQKLMILARQFDEMQFLDSDRFSWLEGYSLADVLLGTYAHHQEHFDAVSNTPLPPRLAAPA